jgi:hypothetical protein
MAALRRATSQPDSSDPNNPLSRYDTIYQSDNPQDLTGWTVGNSVVWGYDPVDINVNSGHGYVDSTGVGDNGTNQTGYPATGHGTLSQTVSTLVGQPYTFSIYSTQDTFVGFDVYANAGLVALAGVPGFWNYQPDGAIWLQLFGTFIAVRLRPLAS